VIDGCAPRDSAAGGVGAGGAGAIGVGGADAMGVGGISDARVGWDRRCPFIGCARSGGAGC
jgi:hypothetical protein